MTSLKKEILEKDIPAQEASENNLMAQPLVVHLTELRKRLVWTVLVFSVVTIVAYCFASEIYGFLTEPLAAQGGDMPNRRLIYTGLTEAFTTYLKLSIFTAGLVTVPFVMLQVWLFMAPGLYKSEKCRVLPFFLAAPVLFACGAALCFFYVIPIAWEFFLGFEVQQPSNGLPIILEARVAEYLSLVMTLIFAFGFAFQLPVVLGLLAQFGIFRAEHLVKFRRWALLIIVIVAAILTPPDVISQVALAIPLYCLYEISIALVRVIQRHPPSNSTEV